jgi:predicted RecB family endonuclease
MAGEAERDVPEGAAVLPLIPAELGVNPLLLAVLHAVVFLDGSAEDLVNPDAASEALDRLAAYIQRLQEPQARKVREDLETLAAFARSEQWPKQQVRFFKEFLADYGIGEESPS